MDETLTAADGGVDSGGGFDWAGMAASAGDLIKNAASAVATVRTAVAQAQKTVQANPAPAIPQAIRPAASGDLMGSLGFIGSGHQQYSVVALLMIASAVYLVFK